jgi:Ras-related protein Rab-1A
MFHKHRTDYDYVFRMLLIGDSGTGKSSLLLRFTENKFNNYHAATIGVDFRIRTVFVNNRVIKLQIWDTAGLERFRTITNAYYRNVDIIMIVYDITNRNSFINVDNWVRESNIYGSMAKYKLLIGNKCDIINGRQVSYAEGSQLSDNINIPFFEVSARSGRNVHEIFYDATEEILNKTVTKMSFDDQIVEVPDEECKESWIKKCFKPDCC